MIVITLADGIIKDGDTTIALRWTPPNKTLRRLILTDGGNVQVTTIVTIRPQVRTRMLVGITCTLHWVVPLTSGKIADIDAIAAAEGVTERYIRLGLPLAFLSQKIITAIAAEAIPASFAVTEFGALQAS